MKRFLYGLTVAVFVITAFGLAGYFYWQKVQAERRLNMAGYCKTEGRVLSEAEKKRKVLDYWNDALSDRSYVDHLVKITSKEQLGYEILKYRLVGSNKVGYEKLKIYLFPDLPKRNLKIEKSGDVIFNGKLYMKHYHYIDFGPVPKEYKENGIAYDLVLLDILLLVEKRWRCGAFKIGLEALDQFVW